MELLILGVVCVILGIITGLLPGITLSTVLILLYPFLIKSDAATVLYIYLILLVTIQYYGGISAVVFGVIGEITEQATVANGHALFKQGKVNSLLPAMATHSLLSGIFSVILLSLICFNTEVLILFLSSNFKILLLSSAIIFLIVSSEKKIFNIIMIIAGLILGIQGTKIIPQFNILSDSLFAYGIPLEPMLTGFIIIPALLNNIFDNSPVTASSQIKNVPPKERWKHLMRVTHLPSTIRGFIIGCITGLIPGVSYAISSTLAFFSESMINRHASTNDSLFKYVLAAESATKAGAIVVLLPLFLFWVPIVPSEAILLSIFETSSMTFNQWILFFTDNLHYIIGLLILLEIVNWIISGYLYKYIAVAYTPLKRYGYKIIMCLVCLSIVYQAFNTHSLILDLTTLGIAVTLGMLLQDVSGKMSFLFAFFISASLLPAIYRWTLVHF